MKLPVALALPLLLALLVGCGSKEPVPEPKEESVFQPWVKKGVVLPPGFAGPRSNKRLSAPNIVKIGDDRLRMYFWGAGDDGHYYIFAAEAPVADPMQWKLVGEEPVLGPTPGNKYNDQGPSFPWVLPRDEGGWLMYYCGWGSWAPKGQLSNRTSLAISHDEGLTFKTIREPMLPLGEPGTFDAGITGSVCVRREAPETYKMWYTAGERYEIFNGANRGIVHMGYATSSDGMEWTKLPEPIVRARQAEVEPYEAVVSKPSILFLNGKYHMWFSAFAMDGKMYRLRYANSDDGIQWKRYFDKTIFDLSPGEFDSENQSYPAVVEVGDELWMFYVGNRFGDTGIGLATMKTAALKDIE